MSRLGILFSHIHHTYPLKRHNIAWVIPETNRHIFSLYFRHNHPFTNTLRGNKSDKATIKLIWICSWFLVYTMHTSSKLNIHVIYDFNSIKIHFIIRTIWYSIVCSARSYIYVLKILKLNFDLSKHIYRIENLRIVLQLKCVLQLVN